MSLPRLILPVVGNVERFADQAALDGNVSRAARADGFVDRPAHRTMIHDAVVRAGKAGAVHGHSRFVADADSQITQDDIVRSQAAKRISADAYPVPWSCLPGDCQARIANDQLAGKFDGTADAEHD